MDEALPKSRRRRGPVLTEPARKLSRKLTSQYYNSGRICIGSQMDRWNQVKADLSLKTHAGVAEFLLDL